MPDAAAPLTVLISGEATEVFSETQADACLPKPFNTEQMQAVLRPLLPDPPAADVASSTPLL